MSRIQLVEKTFQDMTKGRAAKLYGSKLEDKIWKQNTVKLGYNVMKGTEYFVSL
jgi:hypothetical protein